MVKNLIKYIEFLRENYGFNITIHEKTGRILNFSNDLIEYNIHSNPYCLCVKSSKQLWDTCIAKQCKVYRKAEECDIFYGSCFAGMEEFVLPIKNENETIGFVSVCGYCRDLKKAEKKISELSCKYLLDKQQMMELYEKNVNLNVPDIQMVKTLVFPVCAMLELIYMKSEQYIHSTDMSVEANFIYGHVLAYIRKNYNKKIRLSELSGMCYCSDSYISHLFKKHCGKSIRAYTNDLRISEAKKLLKNTGLSIKEISERTGFFDSNYFSNSFKKETGVSPKEYRKNGK